MTSQEFVESIYPKALAKRYTKHNGEVYYLIWSLRFYSGNDAIRLGKGKTASSAWINARENIKFNQQGD